jgi:hypothetical protein
MSASDVATSRPATAPPVNGAPADSVRRSRRAGAVLLDLAVLAAMTIGVVALHVWRSRSFFLIDDGQNEFLPYFTDMGRQWLDGHVPVLTSGTIFGGNYFIAIERPVFAPQTILFSILAAAVPRYVVVATTLAATNIFLTAVGGWLIGRVLRLGRGYSLLLATTVATLPVFLFMYASSWWNGAIATAWLTFAVAALLNAVRRPSLRASVLLGVATLLVLISGWPHALIGLLVIGACVLLATVEIPGGWRHVLRDGAWKALPRAWAPVLVPMALAALVSVPVYAEFVAQGDLLNRFNEISNDGNFCVPTLDQSLGVMNPLAASQWNCWGGYTNWPIAIGFVSILTTVALVFWSPRRGDRVAGALIASAVVLFLLTQLPSAVGSTHYPFRFLPLLGLVVAVLVFHLLRHGERRVTPLRIVVALLITVVSAFLGVARERFPDLLDVAQELVFVALTVAGIVVVLRRWERFRLACFVLLTVAGVVLIDVPGRGLAPGYLYFDPLVRQVHLTAEQQEQVDAGFVVVTQMPNAIASAGSARSLLLDWRSFNGYDPVGQRNFMVHFGNYAPQGFYDANVLQVLGQPADVDAPGVCDFQVYGVRSVIAAADLDGQVVSTLERCGFTLEATRDGSSFWAASTDPVSATLSYADPGIEYADDATAGERHESATITANPTGGTVMFARLWWPGYTATLNGRPVPTATYQGILPTVELPPGATGRLELTYTPQSWRWSLPASGLGVLLAVGAAVGVAVRRRRTAAADNGARP